MLWGERRCQNTFSGKYYWHLLTRLWRIKKLGRNGLVGNAAELRRKLDDQSFGPVYCKPGSAGEGSGPLGPSVDCYWGCSARGTKTQITSDIKWRVGIYTFLLKIYFYLFDCVILSRRMWDLVPWPGIELKGPCIGSTRYSHWTTREVWLEFVL